MTQINFSIIIPHRNLPKIVSRCISSIPERSDIQIILVDDSSDISVVLFLKELVKTRKNIDLVLTDEGYGAGYARNVGIGYAKGTWVLFADADDFYMKEAWNILDKYMSYEGDSILWKCTSVYSNNIQKASNRHLPVNLYIDLYLQDQLKKEEVLFKKWEVWSRMYKRSFLISTGIKFDQTSIANDVMFIIKNNFLLRSFLVIPNVIYCITLRENSITYEKYNSNKSKERIDVLYSMNAFFKKNLSIKYSKSLLVAFYRTSPIYQVNILFYILNKLRYNEYNLVDELSVCYSQIKALIKKYKSFE